MRCVCGHAREPHRHDPPGSDCSRYLCPRHPAPVSSSVCRSAGRQGSGTLPEGLLVPGPAARRQVMMWSWVALDALVPPFG